MTSEKGTSFVKPHRRYDITVLVLFTLVLSSPALSFAASSFGGEANPYLALEWFDWKEFGANNSRLVRESGARYGVGFTYNFEFYENRLILKPRAELIGGRIHYDGHTQVDVPVKTHTDYFDGKIEIDLGWRFGTLQHLSLEPFGGIAFRSWSRDIKDATAADGTRALGYTEGWYTAYGRLGLRGDLALNKKTRLFIEAGGKFPFYTENTAYLSDASLGSDVTLKPGNQPSWFAEAGIKFHFIRASFFYDSFLFSKSDIAYSDGLGFFQPKSQTEIFGIRIGASL